MSKDPRGPLRIITQVEEDPNGGVTKITLDCGHVQDRNQIYTYKVGHPDRCFACASGEQRNMKNVRVAK